MIKNISLFIFLNISISLYSSEMGNNLNKTTYNKLSNVIVDENKKPTIALLKILAATGIIHDNNLSTIVTETQKKWLRPTATERWEYQAPLIGNNLQFLFKDLYLVQEIKPLHQHYNYALLLGSTLQDVQNRLSYLMQLWNNGIRFDSLIVLTGKRPLDKTIEKIDWQLNGQLPHTETEMIKMIFDQTNIALEWKNISIIFVDTPLQQTENGLFRRPNTQDTINNWLEEFQPQSGSILAVSHQPFIGYQDAVLRKVLSKNFIVETVGNIDLNNESPAIILDALARWIYNEYHLCQQ